MTSADRPGIPKSLAVDIPADCNRVLMPVKAPIATPDDDARLAFLRERAARQQNASRINNGRDCWEGIRKKYRGE